MRSNHAILVALLLLTSCGEKKLAAPGKPTFHKDIAPIVFDNCSTCHRPGESAPFSLLNYKDVAKRAAQIAEVTSSRFMPPWLPVEGHGTFIGERHLTDVQIETFKRWHDQGAPEGNSADSPPAPVFTDGWQLGQPDLIVTMEQPFTLPADGTDIYRNFVIPVNTSRERYVRGVEFRPGNNRVVHHAFVLIDDEGGSAALDQADPGAGYGGMDVGQYAHSPGGHFVSWQPGKRPSFVPQGMSWRLPVGTSLVLQMHMQTTGKPESVSPSIGLFFTDEKPQTVPYKIILAPTEIDIPPGEKNHALDTTYTLPVDVKILALIPHAHYLAKEMHAWAELPHGSKKWLLRIDDWDFNWQGDYRFVAPVFLPKGSTLHQHFTYDNSAQNPRNPNIPPERVRFGPNTTDEMGELWLQMLPGSYDDYQKLNHDYGRVSLINRLAQLTKNIATSPADPKLRTEYGKVLMAMRRNDEAISQFNEAIRLDDPGAAEAYYSKGMIEVQSKRMEGARTFFEAAIARTPGHFPSLNGLGMISMSNGDLPDALTFFRRAVQSYAGNASVQANLGLVLMRLGNAKEAITPLEIALAIEPNNPKRTEMLDTARALAKQKK